MKLRLKNATWNSTSQVDGKKAFYQSQSINKRVGKIIYESTNIREGGGTSYPKPIILLAV